MPDIDNANLGVPAELEFAGSNVRGVSTTVAGELDGLKRELEPIAATWTGDTYDYFNQYENLWRRSAVNLFGDPATDDPGLLGVIAKALDIAWLNYQHSEHANKRTWLM